MIGIKDKQIYFPKSFNEQMAWIDEKVEHIIKYDKEHNIRFKIQEKAREWYEKYDAELVKISHDTLTFNCRKLIGI